MHKFLKLLLWASVIAKSCDAFTLHPPLVSNLRQGTREGPSVPTRHVFASAVNPKSNLLHNRRRLPKSSTLLSTKTNGSDPFAEKNPLEQNESEGDDDEDQNIKKKISMFIEMALPYYQESSAGRWLFAGMIAMTLLNSGVSVAFSYVGKDFWNALNSKDTEQFYIMLWRYAGALLVGSPVSVLYSFQRERLA